MKPALSIVIPCYNEEASLPQCVASVDRYVRSKPAGSVEVIVVDDGSADGSWQVLGQLLDGRSSWRALRFVANRGSHVALRCAFRHAAGSRVVNLPVDLQDPVENIDRLQAAMDEQRVDAVFAVRQTRGDGLWERMTSRMYNRAMHLVNLRNVPLEGTSQFLVTDRVARQINAYADHGFTFEGFLAGAPLQTAVVWYDRAAAPGRVSRWTFSGKVQHALNTLLSFSNAPVRAVSLTGIIVAGAGVSWAALAAARFALSGISPAPWSLLTAVVLVIGGLNLVALGLVGEYAWRILDESRSRPLYQIDDRIGFAAHDVFDPDESRAFH